MTVRRLIDIFRRSAKIVPFSELFHRNDIEELKKHNDKHQANNFLDEYANGKETLFAWVLEDIEIEVNLNRILFLQVHGAKLRLELERKRRNGLTRT